jgi:hypothetical protein
MTTEQEKEFTKIFEEKLNTAKTRGMSIGMKSISKVILDKTNTFGKTAEEIVEDIRQFCKVGLGEK